MKISHVIDELVEERSLEAGVLGDIICEGLLSAFQKKYPNVIFKVIYDKKKDELGIFAEKTVVSAVDDTFTQISLRKARAIKESAKLDEVILVPFDEPIGRIEILKAKQIIAQRIRSVEAAAVYNEFKSKEGTLLVGTVHKAERNGMTVKIGETLAFLPKSLMIPGDKCVVGYTVRALLREVLAEPRNDNQLILDRSSKEFLVKLFELEIPEIYEKIVEIKRVARIPGYKSKIVVASHDKNIDPIGTCIGFGGARIKPVLRELGLEKIDVIGEKESLGELVAESLKPAQVNRVDIINGKEAQVWVDADQRSLAIGKMGQNIRLASELTGVAINLMQSEGAQAQLGGEGEGGQGQESDSDKVEWEL